MDLEVGGTGGGGGVARDIAKVDSREQSPKRGNNASQG